MKRTLIAVAVALLASPALALEAGPPFEQNELDRTLPNVPERATQFARAAGDTRTDAGPDDQAPAQASAGSLWARGPWAHDWNFIAPSL